MEVLKARNGLYIYVHAMTQDVVISSASARRKWRIALDQLGFVTRYVCPHEQHQDVLCA